MKVFIFLYLLSFVVACGDGDFTVNTEAGEASNITVEDTTQEVPSDIGKEFFEENLFSVVETNCATSGCHLVGDAAQEPQTFFQIDPDSFDESWLWLNVRRDQVRQGDYAGSSSATLKSQKDAEHNTFTNFSDEQNNLIDEWTALSE